MGVILNRDIRKAQRAWSSCCGSQLGTDILEGTRRVTVLNLLALLVQAYQFPCFTGTRVQRLTQNALLGMEHEIRDEGTEFTCFTCTKVQILTQKLEAQAGLGDQVALGWAKLAFLATLDPTENLDMAFKVRAERIHVA